MAIEFFPMLACCFRPSSSSPAVRRRPDKAEKRRWVDEQVGLHLAARTWDGYGYGKGGAVDVSRYGDVSLEAALGYEFERRWWFAEMTRLLALVDDDDAAAAAAGKSGGTGDNQLAIVATEQTQSPPAAKGASTLRRRHLQVLDDGSN